jgi:DHA1 family inner membrane transport protein
VYSYITPTLTEVSGLSLRQVPFVLAVFGSGMILGNLLGAWLADRALMRAIGALLIWNVIVLGTFSLAAPHAWMAVAVVLLIGTGVAIVPALQVRLMDVAGDAQTLAAALNHSAFNVANALGAWLGGLAIAGGLGFAATGWVGALLALAGLIIFALSVAADARGATLRLKLRRPVSSSLPNLTRRLSPPGLGISATPRVEQRDGSNNI